MQTVQHPAFPEITHEINKDDLAAYLAAGYVEVEAGKTKATSRTKK